MVVSIVMGATVITSSSSNCLVDFGSSGTCGTVFFTGKSLSEALILASTNPHYAHRLFIELRLRVQYKKTTSSVHVVCTNCFLFLFWQRKKTCAELVFSCNSMNNLMSYNGLIDARMRAFDKDLPVLTRVVRI